MQPLAAAPPVSAGPAAPPPTWAVVVVHGVGETGPGSTLEAFVPALLKASNGKLVEIGPPGIRMLFAEKDNPLPPIDPYPKQPLVPVEPKGIPLASRFPMSFRELEVEKPQPGMPARAVIAEVFWSDLSAPGKGLLNLLLQAFTIIFHLRFVADQGAELKNGAVRWFRLIIFCASWLLCGPVASLNAVVLYLVAAHALLKYLAPWTGLLPTPDMLRAAGIVGLVVGIAGTWFCYKRAWGTPWVLIFVTAGIWCALVALASFLKYDELLANVDEGLAHTLSVWAKGDPFYIFITILLLAIRLAFALIGLLVFGGLLLWCVALWSTRADKAIRHSLFGSFGVLLLQIGMWVILVPLVAIAAFQRLDSQLLEDPKSSFSARIAFLSMASDARHCSLLVFSFRFFAANPVGEMGWAAGCVARLQQGAAALLLYSAVDRTLASTRCTVPALVGQFGNLPVGRSDQDIPHSWAE